MNFIKFSDGNNRTNSVLILMLLFILSQSFLVLSQGNGFDPYSNDQSNDNSPECNYPKDTSTITIQKMTNQEFYLYGKLIQKNLDITAIDINSKDHVIYILGIIHGNELDKDTDSNLVLVIDTKLKKANKIMINDNNLDLDKILFDETDNKLYLTGMKLTKNNDKFVKNDVIYLISLPDEKQEILFNNRYTDNTSTPPQNNDEIGIIDVDVGTKSNNAYVILNEIDGTQNNISASHYQSINGSFIINDIKSKIYVIPFGNEIINSPDQKVNYVLINGITSYDKDVIFVLNETTGSIIKNFSLPSLNSRELALDSKKGQLYVLGDSFAYNKNIKGFSKQCEIITSIDTVGNNLTILPLGDFIVKDFIKVPDSDTFYIIGKNHILNSQQKSIDDYLLELDTSTGTTKSIMSIPLNLNYIIINDISNTLFVIGKDLHQDQNVMVSMDLNRR